MPTPHCGHCQYNLTGIKDNRCPECGWLFIEAGVKIVGTQRRDRRKHVWLAAILGGFLLAGISVSYAMMARARMQAAVARQKAVIAQQQALAAQQLQYYEEEIAKNVPEELRDGFRRMVNPNRYRDETPQADKQTMTGHRPDK